MTLTKAHIVQDIAGQNGYTRKQSVDLVETLLEIIKRTLASGEDILISGFGKFCAKKKRERKGRNPATDDIMTLAARRVVTFRRSARLRVEINSGPAND